ncbi:MAG TPA: hypothetical protein VM680_03155 [Verrucomicrobiae bacterium]|nr:hypothetical protein [Verrucomicrobiae bacterium]
MLRILLLGLFVVATRAELRLSTFDVDVTPPIGSVMAYDPVTNKWDMGLRARGIVLEGAGEPIVLCSVDWIGIANESHDEFRRQLARAAGTVPERVTVHSIHQHDAPECDFSAEALLKKAGRDVGQFESTFQRQALSNLCVAVADSKRRAQAITHVGLGSAKVEKVASNRRIFGPDGKVRAVRYTACADADLRAEPEGVIDPAVSLVSFWHNDTPVAVLSYYATHPQSYYRTGIPNPDFPGIARFMRQMEVPSALHVHFNGAGGNIGAGKYNDGSPTNRFVLAQRLADGMKRAWAETKKEPITADQVKWTTEAVSIPPAAHLTKEKLAAYMMATNQTFITRGAASRLAWVERSKGGQKLLVSCLSLGSARILNMPGELFVEYQLAAKAERPDLFVAMAAYGDYGTWYIGTSKAYAEGGYETSEGATNVGPEAEPILRGAISKLLKH